jgi:hypothetical protein
MTCTCVFCRFKQLDWTERWKGIVHVDGRIYDDLCYVPPERIR